MQWEAAADHGLEPAIVVFAGMITGMRSCNGWTISFGSVAMIVKVKRSVLERLGSKIPTRFEIRQGGPDNREVFHDPLLIGASSVAATLAKG
jgi:hypothetical protein